MTSRRSQRGIVAIIVVLALFSVTAIAGLALASSHFVSNKSRLQNVLDAAALSSAKVLDQTGNVTTATSAANATLAINAAAFPELAAGMGGVSVAVQFSNTLAPFTPGSTPGRYVRIRATNFTTDAGLLRVASLPEVQLRASAVAGPSPAIGTACNVAPMLVCGNPTAGAVNYGYPPGSVQVLKIGSGTNSPIGPGNFMLARLGGSGGSVVRENLAGGYQNCATAGTTVETQTGNVVGPVAQGLNTRFGDYGAGLGIADYPPDVVTRQPTPALTYTDDTNTIRQGSTVVTQASQINFNHATYASQVAASNYNYSPAPGGSGAFARREFAVPIANCTGANNGNSTLPLLGFACFFILQPVQQSGQNSFVYGEALQSCAAGGRPGPAPTAAPGPHIIQLYRDAGSPDS
ncbi:MAG: pilus assembly protein TadG-related protein [Steroidobacteraceae bacterium]